MEFFFEYERGRTHVIAIDVSQSIHYAEQNEHFPGCGENLLMQVGSVGFNRHQQSPVSSNPPKVARQLAILTAPTAARTLAR